MKRVLGLLLGLAAIVAMSYFCFLDKVDSIKENILSEVKREYQQRGLDWVVPRLKGDGIYSTRTLILEGTAPNATQKEEAQKLALSQNEIFSVVDKINLQSHTDKTKVVQNEMPNEKEKLIENKLSSTTAESNRSLEENLEPKTIKKSFAKVKITKEKDGKVSIEGLVGDIDTLNSISTRAKQLFGKENINNQLTVGDNVIPLPKDDLIFSMDELATLDYGQLNFVDKNLTFEGYSESENKKVRLNEEFKLHLGKTIQADINITAPKKVKPQIKLAKTQTVKKEDKNETLQPLKTILAKKEPKIIKIENKSTIKGLKPKSCQKELSDLLKKHKIYFTYNSTKVQKRSYPTLEQIKSIIKKCPSNKGFIIEGHTDSDGSDRYNLILSQKRADEIKNYLTLQGVKEQNIVAIGYGERKPLVKNSDNRSKAKNRRIEIKVVDASKLSSIKRPQIKTQKPTVATKQKVKKRVHKKISKNFGASYCQKSFDKLTSSQKIYFSLDKKRVSPHSKKLLNSLAKIAKMCPNATIYINAYTDSIGSETDNLKLSKTKAMTLKRYLEKRGIKGSRMVARGFGENNPIADNATAQGRSKNRRIEFKIKENR